MPLVMATVRSDESPELTSRLIAALTDITVTALEKDLARTTVLVQYVPLGNWARGGVAADGFYVEARVTLGTNDGEQKAQFVREVNRDLERILHSPGYVLVNEVNAESWGYAGEVKSTRHAGAHRGSIAACTSSGFSASPRENRQ